MDREDSRTEGEGSFVRENCLMGRRASVSAKDTVRAHASRLLLASSLRFGMAVIAGSQSAENPLMMLSLFSCRLSRLLDSKTQSKKTTDLSNKSVRHSE